jgi:hypothetical protein
MGDSLRIGDKQFPIRPADISKSNIWVEEVPGVTSYDPNGNQLCVTRKSSASVLLSGNIQQPKEIVVKFGCKGKSYKYRKIQPTEENMANEENAYFFCVEDMIEKGVSGEYHVAVYNEDAKICEKRFLYLPDFSVKYDTSEGVGFYYKSSEGIATANGVSSPHQQKFKTSENNVKWVTEVKGEKYLLETRVPSLFISFIRDSWLNPSEYEKTVGRFLIGDKIRVRLPLSGNVSLWINEMELLLLSKDEYEYTFDVSDWARQAENNAGNKYVLKIKLEDKMLNLTEIITSNEYKVLKDDTGIKIEMIEKIENSESKYVIKTEKEKDREGPLNPGTNQISGVDYRWFTLEIMEKSSTVTGESWRTVDNKPYRPDPEYDYRIEKNGCTLLYRNWELFLKANPKSKTDLFESFHFYKESPWSRKSVEQAVVLKLIPLIVQKSTSTEGENQKI